LENNQMIVFCGRVFLLTKINYMNTDNPNPNKSARAIEEENILRFWQEKNIFEKSLEKDSPKGEYVFYEGPPTANGKPGIHHLEARAFKDAIPRYKTMQGFHVRRKGGWDTHGLPVELQVEKELGLKSKKEVEAYGVAAFNKKCRESVWQYLDIWNKFTHRTGYWVDQQNPYVTYHNSYIESLWNVVGKVNERGLLYKDYKVVPWCPRCGTALSSHELAQGYQDVKDLSVFAKFKLVPGQKWGTDFETKDSAYILAWTTTPWTLPGNVALAVGKDIMYTALRIEGVAELYIVAKDLIETVFKDQKIEIVHDDILGSMLIGLEYVPLYPYLKEAIASDDAYADSRDKAFKVYASGFCYDDRRYWCCAHSSDVWTRRLRARDETWLTKIPHCGCCWELCFRHRFPFWTFCQRRRSCDRYHQRSCSSWTPFQKRKVRTQLSTLLAL
jgi:isoleucyl-tRNA synthetase